MKAGKELDALVAEKVMGWTRWANARGEVFFFAPDAVQSEYIQSRISEGGLTPHAGSGDEGNAPDFSTYIAAAWKVVEKMRRADGLEFALATIRLSEYEARFWSHQPASVVIADTAPLAICLAALKACGVEVPA